MMKKPLGVMLCLGAAVAGLSGGYVLRGSANSEKDAGSTEGKERKSDAATPKTEGRTSPSKHAILVGKNTERSRGANHWLHWMAGVENAALADLPGLARMAKDNPIALRMIAYRWCQLDPKHFFETLKKESRFADRSGDEKFPIMEMGRYLFEEWSKDDPEAAIAALSSPDAIVGHQGLRHSVVDSVMRADPRRGLQLLSQWSIFNNGPRQDGVKKWAAENPRDAAQAVLDYPVGFGAEYTMQTVAKIWSRNDPEAALNFALEKKGRLSETLREIALKHWAESDLNGAATWLAGLEDERLQAQLSPSIVEAWAKDDPEAALAWCQENLDGHRLVTAVSRLAAGAAATDQQAAANLVMSMEESPARTQAAISIAQSWWPQGWGGTNEEIPEAAVSWLSGIDDPALQTEVLEKVGWAWSTHDREGMMEFLEGPSGAHAPNSVYRSIMQGLARENPERAMAWAAELPGERATEVAGTAFSVWTNTQPATALDWLLELPATDGRRQALLETFVSSTAHRDEATALVHLSRIPASDRALVRERLSLIGLPEERRTRLMEGLGK